jgi:hypothetical protein
LLQAPEGAVQGAIRRQQPLVCDIPQALRQLVPMKLFDTGMAQTCGGFADRVFERD